MRKLLSLSLMGSLAGIAALMPSSEAIDLRDRHYAHPIKPPRPKPKRTRKAADRSSKKHIIKGVRP